MIQDIKIAFFLQNYRKLPIDWGFCPQTPFCTMFRLPHACPNFDIVTFSYCHKLSPFSKILGKCQTRLRLLIFHDTIFSLYKKFILGRFLLTSLSVICGLSPPSKILASPMARLFLFLSLVTFRLGYRASWPPSGYAYDEAGSKKPCLRKFYSSTACKSSIGFAAEVFFC